MNIGKESEKIEFKESLSELEAGIRSISSMLNRNKEATLYFGVKDDGSVIGIDIVKDTIIKIKEKIKDDELVKVKKLNLNNISNFIYELPSKTKTAKNQGLLKIPNYISKMIPNFFELSDNSKTEEIDGAMYKVREVNIELVDVKNGEKYTDRNAKISYKVGQSYVSIISDVFKNVDYVEFDIARIIKLDSKVYHIEIITSDMQEYKLWSKLCNQDFKSSARKYGMM